MDWTRIITTAISAVVTVIQLLVSNHDHDDPTYDKRSGGSQDVSESIEKAKRHQRDDDVADGRDVLDNTDNPRDATQVSRPYRRTMRR